MTVKFPKLVYVCINKDDPGGPEDLLVWRLVGSVDRGPVGVYSLVEEIETRDRTEVRRKGTKAWFKAGK